MKRRLGFLTGGQNYIYIILFDFQNHLSPIETERDTQTDTQTDGKIDVSISKRKSFRQTGK